jgi:hypothetical protein
VKRDIFTMKRVAGVGKKRARLSGAGRADEVVNGL